MNSSAVKIRALKFGDFNELIQLWKRAGLIHKPRGRDTAAKIQHELQEKTAVFLAAEIGKQMVGAVLGTHDGRKGWINRLVVDPDFQHKGIARQLVQAVEERLDSLGIEIVACLIDGDNLGSMEFFRECGYTEHRDIIYFAKKKHPDV